VGFKTFEELEVWKKGRELRNEISKIVRTFPKEEKYNLAAQILKSSRSVTANIAEGFGCFHHQENIQFCRIARGSLYETLEHLICAYDEGYISGEEYNKHRTLFDDVLKLLNGYISYLKKSASSKTERK
jgi:four helix bundle protein